MPDRWCRSLTVVATVLVLLPLAASEPMKQKEPPKRAATVVDFTGAELIGFLVTFERSVAPDQLLTQMKDKPKQELSGKVTVPADQQALLFLTPADDGPPGSPPNLKPLDQFAPEDLTVLAIQATRVTAKEMERLVRHKALRVLIIGPLQTASAEDLAPLTKLTWLEELSLAGPALAKVDPAILLKMPGAQGGLRSLDLAGADIDDEGLRRFERHKNLRELDLTSTQVTDAGLVHLSGLTQLRILRLGATKVVGSGLHHLSKLRNLKILDLTKTPLSDDNLAEIRQLTSIEELSLRHTGITDAALKHVGALKQLQRLNLDYSMVQGHSFEHLADLDRLETLTGAKTPLEDEAMKHLRKLDKLNHVFIPRSAITDKGLMYLAEVKSLRQLDVSGTKVTKEGIRQFQEKRPDVKGFSKK